MKRLLGKIFLISALTTLLGISLLSAAALADCTYGTKECRDGYWWICDKCGSENCWKYTGRKCELSQLEFCPPEKAGDCSSEQQVELLVRAGCIEEVSIEFVE
ncbi:MAG: hypothetical protein ACXWMS_02775 [Syntrophales bacterium]